MKPSPSKAKPLRLVELFMGDGAVDLSADDAPPTEFQIFPAGKFTTSKGEFTYDPAISGPSVMENRKKRGVDLVADYEHMSLASPPIKAPASAWYDIEAREDGLYAVNVRWTPVALEHFRNKEYRYFSPAFHVNDAGVVLTFKNLALTNMPATFEQEALIAASDANESVDVSTKQLNQKGEAMDELKKALMDLLAMLEGEGEESDKIAMVESGMKKLGFGKMDPKCAEPAHAAPEASPEVMALTSAAKDVIALTDKKTAPEALGTVRSWKESHDKVVALTSELDELRARELTREFDSTIAKGTEEKKLSPALVDGWVKKTLIPSGAAGLVQLRAFLESAAPVAAPPAKQPEPGEVVLTEDDKKVIALTHGDPIKFLEEKKRRAALGK